MFNSIFSVTGGVSLTMLQAAECIGVAVLCGLISAFVFYFADRCSKGFMSSLILLPAVVAVVIIMVNGNLGAGIAVAGTFSLVRFRSLQGTAREICAIFLAMAQGLAVGMGFLTFALYFSVITTIIFFAISKLPFDRFSKNERILKMTIPENLNYTDAFEDLFNKYTKKHTLIRSKTSNMGTLYELSYTVELKDIKLEKEFIDELRCRNANLGISCSVPQTDTTSL